MEVANNRAYFNTATLTKVKSFIVQAPVTAKIKLFAKTFLKCGNW